MQCSSGHSRARKALISSSSCLPSASRERPLQLSFGSDQLHSSVLVTWARPRAVKVTETIILRWLHLNRPGAMPSSDRINGFGSCLGHCPNLGCVCASDAPLRHANPAPRAFAWPGSATRAMLCRATPSALADSLGLGENQHPLPSDVETAVTARHTTSSRLTARLRNTCRSSKSRTF